MVIIMDVNGLTYTMSAAVSDIKNEKTDTAAKTDSTQTKDNNTDQATPLQSRMIQLLSMIRANSVKMTEKQL